MRSSIRKTLKPAIYVLVSGAIFFYLGAVCNEEIRIANRPIPTMTDTERSEMERLMMLGLSDSVMQWRYDQHYACLIAERARFDRKRAIAIALHERGTPGKAIIKHYLPRSKSKITVFCDR